MPPRKRLGQLLTELGVIDEHQLQSALGHQKQWGGKLGAIVVQKGFCKEEQVVTALTKHLGMPAVRLGEAKIDVRAVKFVTRQIAEKLHVFPYELSGSGRSEVVTIAMSDPTDLSAVDQLAFHTGKRIKPMLAGDSEIVAAIQKHYGGGGEKAAAAAAPGSAAKPGAHPATAPAAAPAKPLMPTPPVMAPPAAAQQFPRRFEPAAAAAPTFNRPAAPYIPPPIPVAPPRPAQKLEEIEPDAESLGPPATLKPPEPLEIPEDDGVEMPLEPIAAHSQFGDEVAGKEEIAGEGTSADAVEGLESASLAHEGAAEAKADPMEGLEPLAAQAHQPASWDSAPTAEGNAAGWADEAAPAQPAQDWTAAPEGAPAEAPAGEGWGTEQGWASETPAESAGEQLPPDAILGEADVIEGFEAAPGWESAPPAEAPPPAEQPAAPSEAEAPDSWASIADPLAAQHDQAANDTSEWGESAPKSEASWRETEQPAEEQAAREQAAQEQAAQEQAAQEQAAEEQAALEQAAEQAAQEQAAEQAAQEQAAEQAAQEQAAEQAAQEQAAQEQAAEQAAQEQAAEQAAQEQAAQEQAAQEQAAQEQAAQEQAAQEQAAQEQAVEEQYGAEEQLAAEEFPLESGDLKIEGWVAPPAEPEQQGAGWLGEALAATTPLSAADVGTLSAVGVDPNDGVAALRLLACVLRVFNRRQMLDVDEIAAEIRESRTQAAFANEQAAQGEVSNGGEGGETAPPAESAAEATET
jgi:hypothetical protein